MSQLFYLPFRPVFNSRGLPLGGAKVAFYLTGTTTFQTIYADAALTTPLANPVTADALGQLPDIYMPDGIIYRVRISSALGLPLGSDIDPYYPGQAVVSVPDLPELIAPDGSSKVGFLQSGTGAVTQTMESKTRTLEIAPDDFAGTDTQKVQAALNEARRRGGATVRLKRSYLILATLIAYGGLSLQADPGGQLDGSMMAASDILQESSVTTPGDVNRGITIGEGVVILCGGAAAGNSTQIGINLKRVSDVKISGVTVRGAGGSGIRWGFSQTDTKNVLVENCTVSGVRSGDAIQGVGQNVVVQNNTIGSPTATEPCFGDTGIALLADFDPLTNPSPGTLFSKNVKILNNRIFGNYDDSGTHTGGGSAIQTGIALGPFNVGYIANVEIDGNYTSRCYVGIWAIVMSSVFITNNKCDPHAATATGNIRVDGISNSLITGNQTALVFAGTGNDYAGILLNSGRFVYGASVFDASIENVEVARNICTGGIQGVRATVAQVAASPAFTPRIKDLRVRSNAFSGVQTPVMFAPQPSAAAGAIQDTVITGNKADVAAQQIVSAGGSPTQFDNVRLAENVAPAVLIPVTGTGAAGLKCNHSASGTIASAGSGTAVNLVTLQAGNYTVDVAARVANQNNAVLSSTARVHVNGTAARLSADNGAAMVLALSGQTVRATQSAGGTADITFDLQYAL